MDCVYCAVQKSDFLQNSSYLSASHRGRRGLNLGQSMWDLWWTKWNEQVFLQVLQFSPLRIIPPVLNIHLYLPVALTRSIKERSPRSFQKSMLIRKSGSTRHRSNFRFSALQRLVRNFTSPTRSKRSVSLDTLHPSPSTRWQYHHSFRGGRNWTHTLLSCAAICYGSVNYFKGPISIVSQYCRMRMHSGCTCS